MRCPAFIPVVYPDGRNRRDGGRLVGVAEGYRAWLGLLSSDDASLVAYLELAVQPFQDFHRRPGIAGAFRRWQQLRVDSGRGQNRTLTPLWPPVFAGEQDVGPTQGVNRKAQSWSAKASRLCLCARICSMSAADSV